MLKDPNRNVSIGKAQPLQQESSCYPNTHLIRSPRLQTVSSVLLDQGKALTGRFVNVSALLNFLEYPLHSFGVSMSSSRQRPMQRDTLEEH